MISTAENANLLKYAPLCLFTYNRLEETLSTIESLQKNYLAAESDLFIFADGPKDEADKIKVAAVREFLKQIEGFRTVKLYESDLNKGLANSIINGVTQIIHQFGKVVVLEDDLTTSPNFLNYMNQALNFYENQNRIFAIAGYTISLKFPKDYAKDHYFSVRPSSWGWATWRDRWEVVDWEVSDYKQFLKAKSLQRSFNIGGSDLTNLLKHQMNGKINSWAIRWCYSQWKNKQLAVYPRISKVKNIGFKGNASNTRHRIKEYETDLDKGLVTDFSFSDKIVLNDKIATQFSRTFSIKVRIKNKILKLLSLK